MPAQAVTPLALLCSKPMSKNTDKTLDPKLLSLLVCPKSRGSLTYDKKKNELISKKAKLAYPIRDGIPIMLTDEARKI